MKKINLISGLAVAALILGMSFTSCSSSNNSPTATKGTDPSTIATADLVAYFPFNGNGNDSISGMKPITSPNVSFVTARRKSGYQGKRNAYFLYNLPAASKLRNLQAFAISMWLNEPQVPNDSAPVPLILQIKNDSDLYWGNLTLTQDRMGTVAVPVDSLNLKAVFHSQTAVWSNQFVNFPNPAVQASKWIHLVYQYDNITSMFSVYVNGVPLTLPIGTSMRYSNSKPATGVQPPFGNLVFNHPDQMVFGGWLPKIQAGATDTWMGWFLGTLDELRIYDRALTATEVKALYDAEVTQLN